MKKIKDCDINKPNNSKHIERDITHERKKNRKSSHNL